VCLFVAAVLILVNIKKLDIYGQEMLIFIKSKGEAYLLNPVTIKTELGNIYLKRFANIGRPYIFSDTDTRTRFDWYRIELLVKYMGSDIACDLHLFGQKLEVERSIIELSDASIKIWGMAQPIIINGEEEGLLELFYVQGSNEVRLMLRSAPPVYMTTTLNGEILEFDTGW
jgi:hypothetical protein